MNIFHDFVPPGQIDAFLGIVFLIALSAWTPFFVQSEFAHAAASILAPRHFRGVETLPSTWPFCCVLPFDLTPGSYRVVGSNGAQSSAAAYSTALMLTPDHHLLRRGHSQSYGYFARY
jgi:hypothetical protein